MVNVWYLEATVIPPRPPTTQRRNEATSKELRCDNLSQAVEERRRSLLGMIAPL
jgi:hypothetical protein